jgi:hypothetical protein
VQEALAGRTRVLDAASALASGYRDQALKEMQSLAQLTRIEHRRLSGEPDLPEPLLRLRREHSEAADWDFTEVTLSQVSATNYLPLNNLSPLQDGLYEFFAPTAPPEASKTRRIPGLPLLLALAALSAFDRPGEVQFTSRLSMLPELRALLGEGKRPWCLASYDYEVHDSKVNPLRGLYHDAVHQIYWNRFTLAERGDLLAIHDAARGAFDALAPEYRTVRLEYALDLLLGGRTDVSERDVYLGQFEAFGWWATSPSAALNPGVDDFINDMHERLRRGFAGHPRGERILGQFEKYFQRILTA